MHPVELLFLDGETTFVVSYVSSKNVCLTAYFRVLQPSTVHQAWCINNVDQYVPRHVTQTKTQIVAVVV